MLSDCLQFFGCWIYYIPVSISLRFVLRWLLVIGFCYGVLCCRVSITLFALLVLRCVRVATCILRDEAWCPQRRAVLSVLT